MVFSERFEFCFLKLQDQTLTTELTFVYPSYSGSRFFHQENATIMVKQECGSVSKS